MKKNLIYLLILLVLAVAGYFILNREKRLFPIEDANFKVEHIEKITKIFLSDPSVGNIRLSKDEDGLWIVNDSFMARQDWVAFLLDGLGDQNPSQMVPKSMHNQAIKQLAGNSIKVEVFQGDKKTNAFYIGKDPGKENLAVMLNIKSDGTNAPRPFLVKKGHTGTFLGVRYQTELENWRDKKILYFPKDKIQSISIEYTNKPQGNFTMNVKPKMSILPGRTTGEVELNELRMEKYLSFYSSFFCMGFENDYILKDTFVKAFTPFARVKVTSTEGKEKRMNIYYRQVNQGTHSVLRIGGKEYDGDSFFGHIDGMDFVLISSATAQKMLRGHDEFFEEETPPKTNK